MKHITYDVVIRVYIVQVRIRLTHVYVHIDALWAEKLLTKRFATLRGRTDQMMYVYCRYTYHNIINNMSTSICILCL